MSEDKKVGAPKGNQNAAKEQAATATLRARITPHKKTAYIKAANDHGMKLSAWAQMHLDKAAADVGYDPSVERW